MANAEVTTKEGDASAPAKAVVPLVPLILAMLFAVILSAGLLGGAGYWLVHSGRIALGGEPKKQQAPAPEAPAVHDVALEPLLVNLADESGHAYLRVTMTLSVEDPPVAKAAKSKEEKPEKGKAAEPEHNAEIRDVALGVIGRQNSNDLLAANGKAHLKEELRAGIAHAVPSMKLADLYFTEFLVQR